MESCSLALSHRASTIYPPYIIFSFFSAHRFSALRFMVKYIKFSVQCSGYIVTKTQRRTFEYGCRSSPPPHAFCGFPGFGNLPAVRRTQFAIIGTDFFNCSNWTFLKYKQKIGNLLYSSKYVSSILDSIAACGNLEFLFTTVSNYIFPSSGYSTRYWI